MLDSALRIKGRAGLMQDAICAQNIGVGARQFPEGAGMVKPAYTAMGKQLARMGHYDRAASLFRKILARDAHDLALRVEGCLIASGGRKNGAKRLTFCGVNWPYADSSRYAASGEKQIHHYMDNRKIHLGHLVVFDTRIDRLGQDLLSQDAGMHAVSPAGDRCGDVVFAQRKRSDHISCPHAERAARFVKCALRDSP